MSEALISLRDVCLAYGNNPVVDRVSLDIHPGEILTLIGPNGAGKTSLLKLVLRLVKPDSGEVRHRAGMRVGYMPQKIEVNPMMPLTVADFLALSGADSKTYRQAARQVDIEDLLAHPIQGVSGGELQRVLLCRALLRRPDLLVLDEPAQGVDISGQAEMYGLIQSIRESQACAVLMVSHDLHLVMANTDRVICLNQHVCCQGHPEQVSLDPAYRQLFDKGVADNLAVYTHHHDHAHDIHGNVVCDHSHGEPKP